MDPQSTFYSKLRRPVLMFALYSALPLFVIMTDPYELPLPLLVVPFILLFVTLYVTFMLAGRKLRILAGLSRRRQYVVGIMIAGIPMLLTIFQSLHQLSVKDIIIAVGLVIGVCFYIGRADFLR